MHNPIISSRAYFMAYSLVWVILGIIQMSIEYIGFNMPFSFTLINSFVSNILFFLMGIILWFPIRYMSLSGKKPFPILLNHILTGIIFLALWLIIIKGFSVIFYSDDFEINDFIKKSLYFRAIFAGLIFILLTLVYYMIMYNEDIKAKISNEANLKTMVKEAELNVLKAQINPHFLFNSLNSISSLTMSNPVKARKMIIELSEYLRYSLKHNEIELTSLDDEILNIQRYMDIERIRFGEKLIFTFDIPEKCRSFQVPNMILQPLFENAIKHGVYESIKPVTIHMICSSDRSALCIQISNNFDNDHPGRTGTGLGLRNIHNRLKILYGRDDLLQYSGSEGIFIVTLTIPGIDENPVRNNRI